MIKVRLLHPGQSDVEVTVAKDSVVIGRDEQCDVVLTEPFVSKRHVQILKGLVLVDLRSSNGTFVGGEKVTKPVLLADGLFNLAERLDVAVESIGAAAVTTVAPGDAARDEDVGHLRRHLEAERERAAALAGELSELRRRERDGGDPGAGRIAALEGENQDLRRRLDSLKEEIEGREAGASESLQARLAQEELREFQRRNQELAARLRELEGRAPAPPGELRPVPAAQADELQRLRAELERARREALPPSELFAQLHRENQELRARLEAFESGQASPSMPASELFFQLQSENRELRRRIEELEAAPRSQVRVKPGSAERGPSKSELGRVRAALRAAEGELARLRSEPGIARPDAPVRPAAGAGTAGGILGVARLLVERDAERVEAGETAEEFLALETFRFLRGAERLVTRAAGEMIQLYDAHTKLPDVGGNFRSLTRGLLEDPDDPGRRAALAGYLEQLSRWLVVALGAPRKAALEFAAQLRHELSEEALTEGRPMPAFRIVAGQREAELWRRASEHLKELSPELIGDRIEKLSRETARGLLGAPEEVS